jgi:hypothetical protein
MLYLDNQYDCDRLKLDLDFLKRKERKMKKILITIGVLAIALTLGVAFAAEKSMPMEHEMISAATNNGITYFDTGPGCAIAVGAGAGGLAPGPGLELRNGITSFDLGLVPLVAKGSCVESTVSAGPTRDNGVTIFDTAPVEAN